MSSGYNCDINNTLDLIVDQFNCSLERKTILNSKKWLDGYKSLLDVHQGTIFYNEFNIVRYMNMVNQFNSLISSHY